MIIPEEDIRLHGPIPKPRDVLLWLLIDTSNDPIHIRSHVPILEHRDVLATLPMHTCNYPIYNHSHVPIPIMEYVVHNF